MVIRTGTSNGQLTAKTVKEIQEKVAALGDGFLEIRIDRIPNHRVSERIRRYYWSLVRLIKDYLITTGQPVTEQMVHQHNAKLYMSETFMNYDTMETYQDRYSHLFLDNSRLMDVCHHLQEFWAERGLYLPDPHENSFDFNNPPNTTI